jgi:membrane fusion protein, copper/silver efflux system
MKRFYIALVVVLIILASSLGWFFGQKSLSASNSQSDKVDVAEVNGVVQDGSGKTVKYWYDPMVPTQKFDKPGKSPFMDMQLEPKYANEGSDGEDGGVAISSQTMQNLGIRLEKVETKRFGESFLAIGRLEPDERRFYDVQTRIPGFVERLSVRAVGDPVSKGQKIAEIYAPELLAAQQEYLALLDLKSVDSDDALKNGARNRLKLLGMSEGEIATITKTKKSNTRFGVYAPASGILTELGVREGGQLLAGNSLIQIADLSQVWLIAEVPEREAARLKLGATADITLQSLPSVIFKGKVSYLYPMLDNASRTLQVRIELANKEMQLRPGMYANVEFSGQIYEALAVPSESIIATGKRKVVIVKNETGYRPVELTTGQESDRYTEVLSGLSAGEQVVVSGQFLIDSEASLSGVLARLTQQDKAHDITETQMGEDKPASTEKMPKGRGRVVDLDVKTNHITLNHEPITALGWPSMTMSFKVNDSKQLTKLKAGDEVAFDLKAQSAEDPDMPVQYRIEHIEKWIEMKAGVNGDAP